MAYLNFQNCTRAEYEKVLYSQDARNKIRIWFNNVELQNAGLYCERATIKSRIVPNGAKVFSLNNFISKEIELILHDVAESTIVDQVRISIGTLVNDVYEYVPIGIFNIQDSPVNDKGRITIKLRDNSTKFDFNYNAQPLIDAHEVYLKTEDATYQQGKTYYKYENGTYTLLVAGTDYQNGDVISGNNIYYKTNAATKLQILQDICTKAGVTCNINSFIGSTDLVGTYDNSITAREYISRLAENAGRIATINRNGELIFINIKNLITWDIPLEVVEKYENGTKYKIGKVVYEDGTRRFESGSSDDTLYLDTSNDYINSQSQVDLIKNQVSGFEIDSFKTGRILGNPAIDSYDIIEVVDNTNSINKFDFSKWYNNRNGITASNGSISFNANSLTLTANSSGSSVVGTYHESTSPTNEQIEIVKKYGAIIKRNTTYRFRCNASSFTGIGANLYWYDENFKFLSKANFFGTSINMPATSPSNAKYVCMSFYKQDTSANSVTFSNIGLNIDNISSYVEYTGKTYRTLATSELIFKGNMLTTFDTQIGEEEKEKNVTLNGEETFKKWARTSIDNVNGIVSLQAGIVSDLSGEVAQTRLDVSGYGADITVLKNRFDKDGNVSGVKTTENKYTFDDEGLKIKKSDTDYNTLIDNTGTYYKDGDTIISSTTKDGFLAKDFRLMGQHYYSYNGSNPSNLLSPSNYDFVDERIQLEVDGVTQYAYATFYNGEE